MKDNGKSFKFAHDRREVADPSFCMSLLLKGEIEEFRDYIFQFPYVVNAKEPNHGNVPLHVASSKGDLGLINTLLSFGADINLQDIFGNAAIHYAADKAKRSAIELLLKSGANPNLQDFRGNSPLHIACTNNDMETVKVLLNNNADPEIIDLNDMKPADKSNSPMIKILIDRRITALRTGEADKANSSMQWMSFGVGLGENIFLYFFFFPKMVMCSSLIGVGLGMALAKHQSMLMEQQLQALTNANKPKRKGFAAVRGGEDHGHGAENAMVPFGLSQDGQNGESSHEPTIKQSSASSKKFLG
jgi:hypothetical protein